MKSKKQMTQGVSKSLTGTAIDRISLRLENAKRNRDPKAHREAMAAYNKLSDRHKTMGDQRGYFSKRLLTPPKPKPKTKAGKGKTRKTSLSAEQIIKIAELVSAMNTFAEDHGLVEKAARSGKSKKPAATKAGLTKQFRQAYRATNRNRTLVNKLKRRMDNFKGRGKKVPAELSKKFKNAMSENRKLFSHESKLRSRLDRMRGKK